MDEILISGYYGFKNSGDDALLLSIINDLKKYKKEVKIVVLSSNPSETERIYGVKSINRLNPLTIIPAMIRSKMLISGGGTLIQDGTSTKSLLYYLTIISIAKLFGLKVMLYSNGIGPLKRESNAKRTRKVLNKVDLITLRDEASFNELQRIGVTVPETHLTADPAFTLVPSPRETGRDILRVMGVDTSKRLLCVSVRKWSALGADFARKIAGAVDYAVDKYDFYPVFLPMQLRMDYEISCAIREKMRNDAAVISQDQTTGDILSVIGNMDLCIGMRLHTLIYSASQAVPLIGIVYDPKVSGFMDYMKQKKYMSAESFDEQGLKDLIDETMADYDNIKAELTEQMSSLKKKAEENAKYAAELLEK